MKEDKPSSTALFIARSLVFTKDEPGIGALVPPEMAKLSHMFVEGASSRGTRQLKAFRHPWVRFLVRLMERVTIPGMGLHYVLRKLHLETIARRSFSEGYTQLVVLGAGFDTLTQRLSADPAFDGMTMIEVDHPATQSVKVRILEQQGLLNERVEFIACDIGREELTDALAKSRSYKAGARTLFIAEGLLMYLEPAVIDELFTSLRRTSGARVRIAFTFMEPQEGGRIAFGGQTRLVDLWLKWRGEPFKWGIKRGDIKSYLALQNYSVLELVDTEAFKRLYLAPRGLEDAPLADGDHLCLVEGL
jgi:methyltransferase (TIGR00027 family)